MKNLILFFAVLFTSQNALLANSFPSESTSLINEATVEVTIDNELSTFFQTASFDAIKNTLEFTTKSDIKYIQIFNDNGELEFQLPVMSNRVKISKDLFETGQHKLGFILSGEKDIKFTSVTIR